MWNLTRQVRRGAMVWQGVDGQLYMPGGRKGKSAAVIVGKTLGSASVVSALPTTSADAPVTFPTSPASGGGQGRGK